MAQAAPAANHNSGSTPCALSSWFRRVAGAGLEFMGVARSLTRARPLYEPTPAPTRPTTPFETRSQSILNQPLAVVAQLKWQKGPAVGGTMRFVRALRRLTTQPVTRHSLPPAGFATRARA